ncbi:hypothetical protein D3C87_2005490 [compost metagenome]
MFGYLETPRIPDRRIGGIFARTAETVEDHLALVIVTNDRLLRDVNVEPSSQG